MANFNINVTGYDNQPPTIGDGQKETNYGQALPLNRADFTTNTTPPYSDPEGDLPLNLKITSLPAAGILRLDGVDVTVNQEISFISDIDAGKLTYTPDLNNTSAHSVSFGFEISDEGSNTYVS
jgi:hypothetical protein